MQLLCMNFIVVLLCTQGYFSSTTMTSITVREKGTGSKGNLAPFTGCFQTFPLSERILGHCRAIAL